MAWTIPRNWTAGELITALIMNTHIRDNLNYLKGQVDAADTPVLPHEFGGLASWIGTPLTSFPSGATFDKLAPNTDVVAFDSASLPAGTYKLQAVLAAEGGATVTLSLVNLSDGAPDTAIVSITSTSATGQQQTSSAITFATGGASKTYGVKVKGSSTTLRYAAWGIRITKS